jgi:GNAT superfamily N-acetyltransferase
MLRRTTSDAFVAELSARLRRADARDDDSIATLWDRVDIAGASRRMSSEPVTAYLLEEPGTQLPVAYAAATPTIFEPIYDLQLAIGANALKQHAGDVLLMQVVDDLVARDAIVLRHHTDARRTELIEFLCARGFHIVGRTQDWRRAGGGSVCSPAAKPKGALWTFKALEALTATPSLFEDLLEILTDEIAADPSERLFLPLHPDVLRRRLRAQREGVIAVEDGLLLGVLAGSIDPVTPAVLRIDVVAVRRDRRRQGLATAMLTHLLESHGGAAATCVVRGSRIFNAWLIRCGFRPFAKSVALERLLRRTVRVPCEQLNEYVGRYVVETRAMAPIVIERYGDTLISKTRDMRDVLLPASDCEFFTRHHYGHGRFERDGTGRIVRLVYIEGPHEVVAIRQDTADSGAS